MERKSELKDCFSGMDDIRYSNRDCDGCGRYRGYLIVGHKVPIQWLCLSCYQKALEEVRNEKNIKHNRP
jgi:hypothetical protein